MKISLLVLAVLVAGIVAGLTTNANTPPNTTTTQLEKWGPVTAGLQLALSTTKSHYAPGEPIHLIITVRNTLKDKVPVIKTDNAGYYYLPKVNISRLQLLLRNQPAPLTLFGQLRMNGVRDLNDVYFKDLGAGESWHEDYGDTQRTFDMTQDGDYEIYVVRKLDKAEGNGTGGELQSNTITVTIDSMLEWANDATSQPATEPAQ
jgi:hypothetical protein